MNQYLVTFKKFDMNSYPQMTEIKREVPGYSIADVLTQMQIEYGLRLLPDGSTHPRFRYTAGTLTLDSIKPTGQAAPNAF